jgi:phosphatidylglycerophosphate synthase
MTTGNTEVRDLQPTILSFVKDLPNLCSLAGLACTLLSIYFCILGVFYAAMIGMIWAVAFDWADGLIARRMKGRTGNDQVFGSQLDVLIDIVSYGVAPAVLLLSYGNFDPIFLAGAFLMLAASAIRLSYFRTFGLSEEAQYTGLALCQWCRTCDPESIRDQDTKAFWKSDQCIYSCDLYARNDRCLWLATSLEINETGKAQQQKQH